MKNNLNFESGRIHENKYQKTISGLIDIYGEIYMSEIEIREATPDDADLLITYTKRIGQESFCFLICSMPRLIYEFFKE